MKSLSRNRTPTPARRPPERPDRRRPEADRMRNCRHRQRAETERLPLIEGRRDAPTHSDSRPTCERMIASVLPSPRKVSYVAIERGICCDPIISEFCPRCVRARFGSAGDRDCIDSFVGRVVQDQCRCHGSWTACTALRRERDCDRTRLQRIQRERLSIGWTTRWPALIRLGKKTRPGGIGQCQRKVALD